MPVHSRQVVEVLDASSGSDGDPVDLVVQPVQEEAQELLSVLLAARGYRRGECQQTAEAGRSQVQIFFLNVTSRGLSFAFLGIFTFSPNICTKMPLFSRLSRTLYSKNTFVPLKSYIHPAYKSYKLIVWHVGSTGNKKNGSKCY